MHTELREEKKGERFLAYVCWRVLRDRAPGGQRATLSLGVQRGRGFRWLGVEFTRGGLRAFEPLNPAEADAALVLSGDAADALLDAQTTAFEPESFKIFGDATLVQNFWRRCVCKTDLLALRNSLRCKRRTP